MNIIETNPKWWSRRLSTRVGGILPHTVIGATGTCAAAVNIEQTSLIVTVLNTLFA